MRAALLVAVASALPDWVVSNDMLVAEFPEWDAKRIEAKTGIYQRHIAAPEELTSTLAVRAANALFAQSGFGRNKIEHLIVCTQTPDHLTPSTSCLVHGQLGLASDCGAFDLNMGCTGFVYGLNVAKALVASGAADNVLLVNADTYSKLLDPADLSTRSLFGDGATASLICAETMGGTAEGKRCGAIGSIALGTDGSRYADFLAVKSAMASDDGRRRGVHMDGPAIFNFTLERVPKAIHAFLTREGLAVADVRHFVFHQANAFILDHLRKKSGISVAQMPINLAKVGNLVSASIPFVLQDLMPSLMPGDRVVLVGFGVGLSWGMALLTW